MRPLVRALVFVCVLPGIASAAETVRLKATADIWLSDATPEERVSSAGKCPQFKIKSIQEMAAIRFDASPAKGREVLKATLFLRRASADMLRYVRVSTVNQDWVEGNTTQGYGPADGATYLLADAATKRPWAWPGSEFCDVIMTLGYSLATWTERKELPDGWISVALTPELVYAMVAGNTDGLAVMDGGNLAYHNNMIHSVQSKGSEPYIEVELGKPLAAAPARPLVKVMADPERSRLGSGAVKFLIEEAKGVLCWRITLNGKPVERWRVRHPAPSGPTAIHLEDLPSQQQCDIEVVAVAPGGAASPSTKVSIGASVALAPGPSLGKLAEPVGVVDGPRPKTRMWVWPLPPLVKVSPEKPQAMFGDMERPSANAVWNGREITLCGARGETVSFQLCIENCEQAPLTGIKVTPEPLKGPDGATIGGADIELFKNWCARNRKNQWQPAYCVPLAPGAAFQIPDPQRKLPGQQNQTVYVDVYIPKTAKPGSYKGAVKVEADGADAVSPRIELTVFDFALPDTLSFWPELNAYRVPGNVQDYWRLAHNHRCEANYWVSRPGLKGSGKDIQVDWGRYDQRMGPLLSGEAFKDCRRAGVPPRVMYLPFEDSWPTPLTKQNYKYQGHWPGRGEDKKWINEHYMKAPYIGDALNQDYKDAFHAVERQFIEHFREKGWTHTEMQCFFGGKNTHRIDWGVNMWWTTDEPYHWDDWLALQFFCRHWAEGRGKAGKERWAARGDISRPNWQGTVMDGVLDCVYIGGFNDPKAYRRCRILHQDTALDIRTYGSTSRDDESNTRSVVMLLNMWTNGANAHLPWQTLAGEGALDNNDRGAGGGTAIIVPGKRLGQPVLADMRLKALRDGQQLIEYLTELGRRYGLRREQIKAMVHAAVQIETGRVAGAGADNADALTFSTLKAWQLAGLRRKLAELIVRKP